jgi:acetyl esterase/lipase
MPEPADTSALVAEIEKAPAPGLELSAWKLQPRVVEECEATPIPKDPGFRGADGNPLPHFHLEVPYGPDKKQTLDVSSPPAPSPSGPRPMVALIHGGGWTAGDKHMFWPTMRALNDHGFVAATINYRLARDKARAFPAGVRDSRCALAYLVKHAAAYGGDPTRLAVIGASAGAHIAALIAVQPDAAELSTGCEDVSLRFAGVIAYYGPLELTTLRGYPPVMHESVWEFFRVEPGTPEWAAVARRASPRTFVDETAPPFLLLHGGADNIVPVHDSRAFKRVLDEHRVPSLLVELPDQKHGFAVLGRKPATARATCTAWAFLDRVLAAPR